MSYNTSCHAIPSLWEQALVSVYLSAQSRFLLLLYGTRSVTVLYVLESFFISPALRLFFGFSTHFSSPLPISFSLFIIA
jgi:hypothetical protein